MRARVALTLVLLALIALVAISRVFLLERGANTPYLSGRIVHLTVRVEKGSWEFVPDRLTLARGDRFDVTVVNDDDIPHGFGSDEFKVLMDVPAGATKTTRMLHAKESGSFRFYCSVMCGEGIVATGTKKGDRRGHFDMEGTIVVESTP